jgi:hypothetical protein
MSGAESTVTSRVAAELVLPWASVVVIGTVRVAVSGACAVLL